MQRFGQAVLQAHAAVRIAGGRELLGDGLADNRHDERRDGHVDALDVGRRDAVRGRMRSSASIYGWMHVSGGEGLERRVAAVPASSPGRRSRDRNRRGVRRPASETRRGRSGPRTPARGLSCARARGTPPRCRSARPSRGAGTSGACRRPSTRECPRRSCRRCPPPAPLPASRPSRRPARNVTPNGAKNPVGWKPRLWNCPGATLPTRHEISLPSAMAVIRSRPESASSPTARARRRPPGCSCARWTRYACRRTRAPVRTTVGERGRRHADAFTAAEDAARPRRRHRDGGGAGRPAERRVGAGERQADDVEDAQLRRVDDVLRQIGERDAVSPGRECVARVRRAVQCRPSPSLLRHEKLERGREAPRGEQKDRHRRQLG